MRFSHKIAKLTSGRAFSSARSHLRRFIFGWRVPIELDGLPMFGDSTRMLGVRRVIWRVRPFVPLPDLGEKFDLVTAFMICFNNHKQPHLWGVPEWEFFLDDLSRHLTSRGRVWLELN